MQRIYGNIAPQRIAQRFLKTTLGPKPRSDDISRKRYRLNSNKSTPDDKSTHFETPSDKSLMTSLTFEKTAPVTRMRPFPARAATAIIEKGVVQGFRKRKINGNDIKRENRLPNMTPPAETSLAAVGSPAAVV